MEKTDSNRDELLNPPSNGKKKVNRRKNAKDKEIEMEVDAEICFNQGSINDQSMEEEDNASNKTNSKDEQGNVIVANFVEESDQIQMTMDSLEDEFMSETAESSDDDSVKIAVSKKQLERWKKSIQTEISEGRKKNSKKSKSHRNRSRSSSRESGEVSGQEGSDQNDNDLDDNSYYDEHKSGSKKENKKKRKRSLEETFDKMQRIISKKGFVDANAMEDEF